ncbi:4'-phosphopantetheinyl transferase superfamily protein [Candidatus Woesearchaeota archaeon]|nr:4'-phosphopantetheinyl transferase superfamily protein [Candidatus Woesearchaeota archaeon]
MIKILKMREKQMNLSVGVDIEQVARFRKKNKRLFQKIFSKKELKSMKSCNAQHLAGIFCAKEAVIKACNPMEKLQLRSIEIFSRKDGQPYAVIKSRLVKARNLRISISHSKDYAVAFAIVAIG